VQQDKESESSVPSYKTRSVGIPTLEGASEIPSVRFSAPSVLVDDTPTSALPTPSIARGIPQLEDNIIIERSARTVDKDKGKAAAADKDKDIDKEAEADKDESDETAEEPIAEAEQPTESVEEAAQESSGPAKKKIRSRKAPASRKRKAPTPSQLTETSSEGVRRSSRTKRLKAHKISTEDNADEVQEDESMESVEEEEEAFEDGGEVENEDEYEGVTRPPKKTKAKANARPKPKPQEKQRAPRKPRVPRKPREPGESPRRGRHRAKTPEDAEERRIEEDIVKMKDLCKDNRMGRKSKRGRELENTDWNEVVRRQMAYKADLAERKARGEVVDETEEERLERLASANTVRRPGAAPQIRLVDGRMVIDEESLRVNRHERDALVEEEMEIVEENVHTRLVNSATWSKRVKGDRWDTDSTERFYGTLSMFGTDFEMISRLFPGRSRREIKNKFNCEERKDPARITLALKTRVAVGEFSQRCPAKVVPILLTIPPISRHSRVLTDCQLAVPRSCRARRRAATAP
jgi:transcription factor TFIIIB component B''